MKALASRASSSAQTMLDLLALNVGKSVSIRNRDEADMTDGPRVRFSLHGILEAPDESDKPAPDQGSEWYVRAGESYFGPIGIHFPQSRIYEINECLGRIEVILM